MGYYIRILGTNDRDIHLDELLEVYKVAGLTVRLSMADGDSPANWTLLEISNESGTVLSQIERNPVIIGELGQEELDEFIEDIENCKPLSASMWLQSYLEMVKVIYAFQLFDAAFDDDNYTIISLLRERIWNLVGGILQADGEGFTNEDGFHILWQFSDNVSGEWSCAVLNSSGVWDSFVMDLGDKAQRSEFQEGKVPENSRRI